MQAPTLSTSTKDEVALYLDGPLSLDELREKCTNLPWMCFRMPEDDNYSALMKFSCENDNLGGLLHMLHHNPDDDDGRDDEQGEEEEGDDSDDGARFERKLVTRQLKRKRTSKEDLIKQADKKVKKWKGKLCARYGEWVVSIPTLHISRRFTNSEDSQIFLMSMLRKIDPRLRPSSSQEDMLGLLKILNQDYARRFPQENLLRDTRLSHKLPGPGPFQNFEDAFQAGVYDSEVETKLQPACCVYFHGVSLCTKQFPLGNGPLEMMCDPQPQIQGNWRELFNQVWLEIQSVLPQTLTCLTQESLAKYRQDYMALLRKQSQEFKLMLTSTFPQRLIYFDYNSAVYHASRWEEYRQELIRSDTDRPAEDGYCVTHPIKTEWCCSEIELLPDDVLDFKFEYGERVPNKTKILNLNADFPIVDHNLTDKDKQILDEHDVSFNYREGGGWRKYVQGLGRVVDYNDSVRGYLAKETQETIQSKGKYGLMDCLYKRGDEWHNGDDGYKNLLSDNNCGITIVHISCQGDLYQAKHMLS